MAALSTTPTPNDRTPCGIESGMRMRQFGVTCNAATSSTWACGIDAIYGVAWTGATTADQCAVTFSGSTLTFTTPSGSETGTVYIWSRS